ncbi:hypothetical protein BD779DRAFT_1497173, partial [Infundibulicybe gibba]
PRGCRGSWCGPPAPEDTPCPRVRCEAGAERCPTYCMTTVGWIPKWTPILCGNWSSLGHVATCCRPSRGPRGRDPSLDH